jgi:hypothetical protein
MIAAIDLDQFAIALAPKPGLGGSFGAACATATAHPRPSTCVGSAGDLDSVFRKQNFGRQARTKIQTQSTDTNCAGNILPMTHSVPDLTLSLECSFSNVSHLIQIG